MLIGFVDNLKHIIVTCPTWFLCIGICWLKLNFKSIAVVYGFFYLIILSFFLFDGYSELSMGYLISLTISSIVVLVFYNLSWKKNIKK